MGENREGVLNMSREKEVKTNAMRFLDKKKIPYKVVQYECDEFTDGIAVADKTGIEIDRSFKTLVTHGRKGDYYVFVIPVAMELDLKAAAKAVGEKSVEMVHVRDLLAVTGYVRGGCSPLGMKKHYKTVMDSRILNFKEVAVSGGRIGSTLLMSPEDLLAAAQAVTGDIARNEEV